MAAGDRPNFDAACFHAQQAVEKLMKAVLIACGEMPPRAHDLVVLNDLVARHLPGWIWPIEALRFLSHAARDLLLPKLISGEVEVSGLEICNLGLVGQL